MVWKPLMITCRWWCVYGFSLPLKNARLSYAVGLSKEELRGEFSAAVRLRRSPFARREMPSGVSEAEPGTFAGKVQRCPRRARLVRASAGWAAGEPGEPCASTGVSRAFLRALRRHLPMTLLLPLRSSPRIRLWDLQTALYFRFSNWKCVGQPCKMVLNNVASVACVLLQSNLVRASSGKIDVLLFDDFQINFRGVINWIISKRFNITCKRSLLAEILLSFL